MRRLGTFLFGGTLLVVAFGCNSILENEPGRLDRRAPATGSNDDTSATEPINGDGAGTSGTNGNENDTSGNAAPDASSEDSAAPDAGTTCTTGSKACGDLCVSLEDPFFGCGGPTCARCEVPNATAACVLGACAVGTCLPGFADCNALPVDGCETNIQTVTACGACGLACPVLENVEMACVSGACTGTCAPGFGDCNGKMEDGCEKDLLSDKRNCGACGTRCVFGRCEQGACVWP